MNEPKIEVRVPDKNQKRPEGLDGLLQGFGPKELQATVQIISILEKKGYTCQSFTDWVVKKVKDMNLVDATSIMRKIKYRIERNYITWEEIEEAIKLVKRKRREKIEVARECPNCHKVNMEPIPVNHRPEMMIDDKEAKSMWQCHECNHHITSTLEIDEEIKPYLVKTNADN